MLRRIGGGRREGAAGGEGARGDARDDAGGAEPFTFLQHGSVLRGSLEATGRVRLHGRIEGDVRVSGVLEVAEDGEVVGATVEVDELKVLGVVRAAVTARVRVELWKGSTLEGDVVTPALDVEDGATFVGRSSMPRRADDARALRAPAEDRDAESLAERSEADSEPGPGAVTDGPGGGRIPGAAGG